jgi:outer membrane receptor protein involved in Fe transport
MKNRSLKASFLFGVMVLSIMLFSTISMMAQATTGIVRGTVADNSGAAIAGATVTVRNENTGAEATTVTNSDGIFEVQSLLPGSYTITVEATNFKRSVKTGFPVKVGIVNPADVGLEAGNVSETVTITAGAEETLQSEQSQISTTFQERKVQDLPSNGAGGGLDTLALLSPGVIANRVGGTNTNGAGLSVNGNRGRSNNFQIDGADNNDLTVGGPALFVNVQDAVQEYQIVTNNFDARYGRNQGAVVNVVTKSGTNEFHGSAFLFYQDAKLLNSLTNIQRRSGQLEPNPDIYRVFGGTLGGPLYVPNFGEGNSGGIFRKLEDRAFFFLTYQGVRNPATAIGRSTGLAIFTTDLARLQAAFPGNGAINTVATAGAFAIPGATVNNQTTGAVISTAFNLSAPTGCPRTIAVGSTAPAGCGTYTAFINPSTGQPFLTGGPYDVINLGTATAPNLFQAAQPQREVNTSYTENYYSLRFDFRVTDKDNVAFRYLNQKSVSKNGLGTISSGFIGDIPARSKNFGGNWTHIFGNSMANDFRAYYQSIGVEFGGGCETAIGCIPNPLTSIGTTFTNISFGGVAGVFRPSSTLQTIGPATNLPQARTGKVYQAADNFSFVVGKHSFTVGAEYKHLDTIVPFLPTFNGAFAFNSAARLANNAPSGFTVTLGEPVFSFIERDQYYFVQDDFKIRPNLTLNLGARYEYTGQPINQIADATIERESNPATALFNPSLPLSVRTYPRISADKNNIAPRLGFAYTPNFWKGLFGDNRTVIRGGFSLAYDAAFYNILLNIVGGAPVAASLTIPAANLPATNSPAPVPFNPTGDVVRGAASASGVLPRGVLNPLFFGQVTVANDFRSPYSRQFSLGIQRQFGRSHIAEVRYVGTQGRDLFQNINANFFIAPLISGFTVASQPGVTYPGFANLLPAGTTAQVCVNDPATLDNEAACNGRQFRQAGVTERRNSGYSDYNALQARYNGNFFNNALSLGASYTFSKTLDNSSEIFDFGVGSPNAQNPFDIDRGEYGLSSLDRPHAFSANFVFDVPLYREQKGFLGRVLGGWQLNGTYIVTSGATYTPASVIGGSFFGLGQSYLTAGERPFYGNPNADHRLVGISQLDANRVYGVPCNPAPCSNTTTGFYSVNELNRTGAAVPVSLNDVKYIINGPGAAKFFGTPFGNVPRNSERGPIFNQLNMSLFKNIRVFENLRIQLRGEAFNVLNHPNPGFGVNAGGAYPVTSLLSAGTPGAAFGEFDDISYANRVIQLGIRIIF